MDKLKIGLQVDIKRSDGRVHQATIDKLLGEDQAVEVKWFENGLSKAKVLGLEVIKRANPTLFLAVEETPIRLMRNETLDCSLSSQNFDDTLNMIGNIESVASSRLSLSRSSRKSIIPQPRLSLIESNEEAQKSSPDEIIPVAQTPSRRSCYKKTETKKPVARRVDPNLKFIEMIEDYRAQLNFIPLENMELVEDNRICVCVRKRPVNASELSKKDIEVITIPDGEQVIVHHPQHKVDLTKYLDNQIFRFDYVFDESASTESIYKFTAQPLVYTIFEGGFATCFAYGQTGSGKTHTMGGVFTAGKKQNPRNGIYAYTAADVFKLLNSDQYKNQGLSVVCSFFEIYGSNVFDLLNRKEKLRVLEDAKKLVQIVGLKEVEANSVEEILQLIKEGSDRRTAGQTSANSNSSRSHAVFQIILYKKEGGKKKNIYGKFSLIDLAGNERGKHTADNSNSQQTRVEGADINKSLLALKECIRAMGRDEAHIPFRGSKLTLILRDSFTGKNAKVCMIANITPCMSSVEDTVNTLRYADRVKELC